MSPFALLNNSLHTWCPVLKVIEVATTFVEVFGEAGEAIAELDVLAGLADAARNAPVPYVRPTVIGGESDKICLKGSRHPLVEAQDGMNFIKNDCEMIRGESWFQLITGPNMGGKSTFIRQVTYTHLLYEILSSKGDEWKVRSLIELRFVFVCTDH